jgi:endoglucanase
MKGRFIKIGSVVVVLTVLTTLLGCQSASLPAILSAFLGRGINLGNALEAPNEGEWGVVLQEEYFERIAEAGFDTVRIPIRWSAHIAQYYPYTIDESFFERVDWAITQALSHGLKTVINVHHFTELKENPDETNISRFERIWLQIAERYKELSDSLYFELLSEPGHAMTPQIWNAILSRISPKIRNLDERHTIIIGEIDGTSEETMSFLEIPSTAYPVIVTFHYYEPMFFTHQGAPWTDPIYGTTGVTWPGPPSEPIVPVEAARNDPWASEWFERYNTLPTFENPAGYFAITERLERAANWGKLHRVPLWLGEFGSIRTAPIDSRYRWTSFVCSEAERLGIDWACWDFCAEFGVFDSDSGNWIEPLLKALIP